MRYQTNQQFDASSAIHLRRIQAAGGAAGKSMWAVFVIDTYEQSAIPTEQVKKPRRNPLRLRFLTCTLETASSLNVAIT